MGQWQERLFLVSGVASILGYAVGVYQLRRPQPHRRAAAMFVLLGVLFSGVVLFASRHSAQNLASPAAVTSYSGPRYKLYASVSDIKGGVHSLAFTQNGRLLVVGTGEGRILVWSTADRQIVNAISAHKKAVYSVSFNHDGGLLATRSPDETTKLWNFPTGAPEAVWTTPGAYDRLAFSPADDLLVLGGRDELTAYRVGSASPSQSRVIKSLAAPSSSYYSRVVFDPSGSLVATNGQGASDQTTEVRVWSTKDFGVVATVESPTDVNDLAISRNGLLAVGGDDKAIRVWDLSTGVLKHTLVGHASKVTAIAFRPDGDVLASGGWGESVKLWDGATGNLLETVGSVGNDVSPIAFSPDGGIFLAAGVYTELLIWARSDSK